jgi:hypothetical protein
MKQRNPMINIDDVVRFPKRVRVESVDFNAVTTFK